ncbi:MAG: YHYH protein, partial [Myxococcales bacterium]|nr:YHYH protein [Myxococcales bacterium]
GSDSDDSSSIEGCPVEQFLDVAAYDQEQDYPAPALSVSCTDDAVIVESNGIPNFTFVPITPNDLQAVDHHFEFPLHPTMAASTSEIPLLGPVAVAVNGIPIFGPNEALPTYGDPLLDDILDFCHGHTAMGGLYHFHAPPECLFTDWTGNTSLVVGYAFDGFPIIAPFECVDGECVETVELRSSWQRTQDVAAAWDAHEYVEGSGDLDECNGKEVNGQYRYYATKTFPYFLGCYRGEPTSNTPMGPGPGMP